MTQNGWTDKETEIQEDFIWGIGPVNTIVRYKYNLFKIFRLHIAHN